MNKEPFCEDCGIKLEYSLLNQKLKGQEWKDGWRCKMCSRRKQYPLLKFGIQTIPLTNTKRPGFRNE